MGKTKALEDGIPELPELIIHHIFSFLIEESREPSLLCKAWLSAWRTRPDLQFIFNRNRRSSVLDFMNGINATLQRYHENKIRIDSLILWFDNFLSVEPEHVNRWLQIAVESGVKRLNLLIKNSFILPQIVFEGKSLVDLWLGCCQLKPQVIEIIRCHDLRKLYLSEVCLDELILQKIISNCPLIDYLAISYCTGLVNIKVTKLQKLKRFIVQLMKAGSVQIEAPILEDFRYDITFTDTDDVEPLPRRLKMYTSQNLKNLQLSGIDITDDLFLDITKNFPRLKNLDISECNALQRIKISSHSITRVCLDKNLGLKEVQIDVPSLNQFVYKGNFIPRFSSTHASCPSVSEIQLYCWQLNMCSKLKDFLMKLNQSKIFLKINFSKTRARLIKNEIRNSAVVLPLPQVQALTLFVVEKKCSRAANILLDGIFWACRPKTIVQYCFGDWYLKDQLTKVLFEMLMFKRNQKHGNLQKTKFWEQDLKDVKLEVLRKGKSVQQPELLDWETVLKVSDTEKENWLSIVFHLEWELL